MEFIDKNWYWVKFNGTWTMAQYLKSGRLQKPDAEWRIDGDLYLPNRIEDIVPGRIYTPDELHRIEIEKRVTQESLLDQSEKVFKLMNRNLLQRILNKDV